MECERLGSKRLLSRGTDIIDTSHLTWLPPISANWLAKLYANEEEETAAAGLINAITLSRLTADEVRQIRERVCMPYSSRVN